MTRAAVLDDTRSVEAFVAQSGQRVTAVKMAIIGTFAAWGPMTDEQLVANYNERRIEFPDVPKASPQSIRSRRAELRDAGVIAATNLPGKSAYGNPSTVWALAVPERLF